MEESFWNDVRTEFPVTDEICYFNSAGMSPLPNRSLDAINKAYSRINQGGDLYIQDDLAYSDALHARLAAMINTSSSNICFAQNTSLAMSLTAAAIKKTLPFDFNIVSLQDEFPSTNVPFEFQGIEVKYVQPVKGVYGIKNILDAVDEKTMAVVVSHVQYSTGFRLDIEKLGKALVEMDLLFIVNATQSFPVFDIDVEKAHIDVLTASFHKWGMCGVLGSMFYTSESFRRMYPNTMAGWLSVKPAPGDFIPVQKGVPFEQLESASQYTFGTYNFHVLPALGASLDLMEQTGREKIRIRIKQLSDYLVEGLMEIEADVLSPRQENSWTGIVLIDLHCNQNPQAVEYLHRHKIITAVRAGKIRISLNFFNNFTEIDNLLKALKLFCEMVQ